MTVINGDSRSNLLTGTSGSDQMNGLGGNDWMFGSIGADMMVGGEGHDRMFGGSGHDTISGDAGNDVLVGQWGHDRMMGGSGNDILFGGSGNDYLYGGSGRDLLVGDGGRDWLFGGTGGDRLFGGSGSDHLDGGAGNDRLYGGSGADKMTGSSGTDLLDGGSGNDTLTYTAELNVNARDYYQGGRGTDRLVLNLTDEEAADSSLQADIDAFEAFLETGSNSWFSFGSLGLWVRDIETLRVVTPEPVNTAPVVAGTADLGVSDEDVAATITTDDLLATVTDAQGDALTVSNVTASTGSVDLVDGAYVYTPDANENGTVIFDYTVSDGTETVAATATLEVEAVNDAPVATDDELTIGEDEIPTIFALGNDTDIDGDVLSIASFDTVGMTGSVEMDENGALVYTPNAQSLRAGETLTDTFTYVVTDGELSDTGTVTITVEGANDGPVAVDDGDLVEEGVIVGGARLEGVHSVDVEDTILLDVLGNDSDVDTGDTLEIVGIAASAELLARADISIVGTGADQRIQFDADEFVFFPPTDTGPAGPGGPPPDDAILVGDGTLPGGGPIGGSFPAQEDLVQFEYTVSDGTNEATATVSLYVYDPAQDVIF